MVAPIHTHTHTHTNTHTHTHTQTNKLTYPVCKLPRLTAGSKNRARTFSQKHGDEARTFLPEKGRWEDFSESKMKKTRIKSYKSRTFLTKIVTAVLGKKDNHSHPLV